MKTLTFQEWITLVSTDTYYPINELLDFKDHYQNLLSYEENLKNFENYLAD